MVSKSSTAESRSLGDPSQQSADFSTRMIQAFNPPKGLWRFFGLCRMPIDNIHGAQFMKSVVHAQRPIRMFGLETHDENLVSQFASVDLLMK
jgi:hypothetical protein